MCFIEKNDYLFWINLEGYDQKLMLRLQLAPDHRGYNDYFSIDRPLGREKGIERLFTLPFKEIENISYVHPDKDGPYTVCFDVIGGDYRLKEIKIEAHCFNYLYFKQILKIFNKSKKERVL